MCCTIFVLPPFNHQVKLTFINNSISGIDFSVVRSFAAGISCTKTRIHKNLRFVQAPQVIPDLVEKHGIAKTLNRIWWKFYRSYPQFLFRLLAFPSILPSIHIPQLSSQLTFDICNLPRNRANTTYERMEKREREKKTTTNENVNNFPCLSQFIIFMMKYVTQMINHISPTNTQ